MRSIWKGALSFGLVTIDIELYTAVKAHSIGFKLLHEKCKTPINNIRWCSHCKREVEWSEIVKGIKLEDDTFFIISPENLKKLKPTKTDTIDITEIVDLEAVEPIYFDQHYYAVPTKATSKAYFLFIKALADLNKIAIGTFVLRDKQYVCALQPFRTGLMLTTLNYEYEIQKLPKLEELKAPKTITRQELQLAEDLIDKLYSKHFDMKKYKDTFVEQLKDRIRQAAKGIPVRERKKKVPELPKEESLLHALRASLGKLEHIPESRRAARA